VGSFDGFFVPSKPIPTALSHTGERTFEMGNGALQRTGNGLGDKFVVFIQPW